MLAITFGVAVVMAVAGPYINALVLLNLELYGPKDNSVFAQISSIYMPLYYGFLFGKCGLAFWTEGYEINGIELCENGILFANKFYAWNSPAIRDMYWGQSGDKLIINIKRAPITTPVPREQREAVDAILENYYRPSRKPTP